MSQPNSNNQTSKEARSVTVVSYALPTVVFVFLVGGMGVWFARSSHQPSTIQAASQVQPITATHEKVTQILHHSR